MKKTKESKNFLLISFLVILAIYLNDSMLILLLGSSDLSVGSSYYEISILGLFVFGMLCVFRSGENVLNNKKIKIVPVLITWITIVSYYFALTEKTFERISYWLTIPLSCIIFFSFYIFTLKHKNVNFVINLTASIVIFLSFNYFMNYDKVVFAATEENITTNASYILLMFTPIILLIQKKWLRFLGLILILLALLSSNKRTGVFSYITMLSGYIIVNTLIQNNYIKKTKYIIAYSFLIFFVIMFIVANLDLEYIISRFKNISEDGGSGRDIIWATTFDMILSSGILNLFIGHGWNMVLTDSPYDLSAHNDFLEVTYDFGIIGLIIYVSFILHLFSFIRILIKEKSMYAAPATASLINILVLSTSSHIIIYNDFLYICLAFWGLTAALYDKEKFLRIKIKK